MLSPGFLFLFLPGGFSNQSQRKSSPTDVQPPCTQPRGPRAAKAGRQSTKIRCAYLAALSCRFHPSSAPSFTGARLPLKALPSPIFFQNAWLSAKFSGNSPTFPTPSLSSGLPGEGVRCGQAWQLQVFPEVQPTLAIMVPQVPKSQATWVATGKLSGIQVAASREHLHSH